MSRVSVARSGDHFEREGKSFFYLGDTVWMTFANATLEEWEQYLAWRDQQYFSVLQFSILPVYHDNSESERNIDPFVRDAKGRLDFGRINESYFEKARAVCAAAVRRGFVPSLGLLWCNYAPDSWAAKRLDNATVMPLEAVKPYVEYAVHAFGEYDPIYFVSGDTRFDSEAEIRHYTTALEALKSASPHSLASMHTSPDGELPDVLLRSKELDFYMYQSGHRGSTQEYAYELAQQLYHKPVKRPVVNAEPCYEAHGHTREGQARFSSYEVRRAMWQGLLSGAKAGVTYGAHGIWSWHRRGARFIAKATSREPLEWHNALRLPGAWDYTFARWAFETFDLFAVEPDQSKLPPDTKEIRLSVSPDGRRFAAYAPTAAGIELAMDLRDYRLTLAILESRHLTRPLVDASAEGSVIRMPDFNSDILVIGEK